MNRHTHYSDSDKKQLLQQSQTIAVVGLSNKPERDSYRVAKYLLDHGYKVIPVNPSLNNVLGQKAYPDLSSVPVKVDIVDVFRKSEEVPAIIDDALALHCPVIWLQLGIHCPDKRSAIAEKGSVLIEDQCILIEHARLIK